MEILSILTGIGLSAAAGFRVFVPMLIMSLAAYNGYYKPAHGFEWLGSEVALVCFGAATVTEIAAYYIPWLDNFLDMTVAPVLAPAAGFLLASSCLGQMPPAIKWSLIIMAGGVAFGVQAATTSARAVSTAATGGLANPIVATSELAGSAALSFSAIMMPFISIIALTFFIGFLIYKKSKRKTI